MSILFGVGMAVLALCLYFVPAFIAFRAKHSNAGALFALNLLLGWTVIGWIVALVWAMMKTQQQPQHRSRPTN
jgi:T4 superinfection immunity protein